MYEGFIKKLLGGVRNRDGKSLQAALDEGPADYSTKLRKLIQAELDQAPRVALLGKTGVGKSSTINALFGTSLEISHFKSCTQFEKEVAIKKSSRELIVFDMPGLLEDIDADERHIETYARVIPQCDVAVWVLDAADRAIAADQMMIRDVVAPANQNLLDRLVIGLNKIDDIQPGNWLESANIPSQTQKASILRRIDDITEKLVKVCPKLTRDRIVPYSAKRNYRLGKLFNAMLDACPKERAWVLKSREQLAPYEDLIDPEILRAMKRRKAQTR